MTDLRESVSRFEALLPYQYELIWQLLDEPLAAAELAQVAPRARQNRWTAQEVQGRLRPLVKRGWLRLDDGIYRVTNRAREAVTW